MIHQDELHHPPSTMSQTLKRTFHGEFPSYGLSISFEPEADSWPRMLDVSSEKGPVSRRQSVLELLPDAHRLSQFL